LFGLTSIGKYLYFAIVIVDVGYNINGYCREQPVFDCVDWIKLFNSAAEDSKIQ
jgi:hypothetical protein